MRIFTNLQVDWLGKRKYFYILSLTIFLAGVTSVLIRGFKFGLDFRGGSEIVLDFKKPIQISEIRERLLAKEIGLGGVEVKTFGNQTGVLIRTELQEIPTAIYPKIQKSIENTILASLAEKGQAKPIVALVDTMKKSKADTLGQKLEKKEVAIAIPSVSKLPAGQSFMVYDSSKSTLTYRFASHDSAKIVAEKLFEAGFQASKVSEEATNIDVIVRLGIADWIKENLRGQYKDNPFKILREDRIGPKVGGEMKRDAVISVFLALLMILVYLAFRFKFIFAAGAVLALFHDVLLTVGLFSLLYGVIPGLHLEIDLTVLAAFLTLIGYSVNDTVIVFDRVRENIHLHKNADLEEIMNKSVNQTMSRTILTGGTVLLSVIILLIFGGDVLRAFSATLFFGIIVGTYSSVFVASAMVLDYVKKSGKKIEF